MKLNEKICQTCGYFRRHYIWFFFHYTPIFAGHCVHPPRGRHCCSALDSCPKWIPQDQVYRRKYLPQE